MNKVYYKMLGEIGRETPPEIPVYIDSVEVRTKTVTDAEVLITYRPVDGKEISEVKPITDPNYLDL